MTVVAAAIGRNCLPGNKVDINGGALVVIVVVVVVVVVINSCSGSSSSSSSSSTSSRGIFDNRTTHPHGNYSNRDELTFNVKNTKVMCFYLSFYITLCVYCINHTTPWPLRIYVSVST